MATPLVEEQPDGMEGTVMLLENINNLVDELFSAEKNGGSSIAIYEEIQKLETRIGELEEAAEQDKTKIRELEVQNKKAKMRLTDRDSSTVLMEQTEKFQVEETKRSTFELEQEKKRQQERIDELETEVKELKHEMYNLSTDKEKLKEHSRKRSAQLHKLEDESGKLRAELAASSQQNPEVELLKREVELLKASSKSVGGGKSLLHEEIERLRKEVLDTHGLLKKVTAEKDELAYQLSTKRKELGVKNKDFEKAKRENEKSLSRKIKELETENKRLNWDTQKSTQKLREAESGFTEIQQKLAEVELLNETLQKERIANTQKISELNIEIAKLEKAQKTFTKRGDRRITAKETQLQKKADRQHKKVEQQLKAYQNEVNKMKKEITGVESAASKTQGKLDSLAKGLLKLKKSPKDSDWRQEVNSLIWMVNSAKDQGVAHKIQVLCSKIEQNEWEYSLG